MAEGAGMTPEEAAELQRKYRVSRRRWAWKIERPYSEDIDKPLPAVLAGVDVEEG